MFQNFHSSSMMTQHDTMCLYIRSCMSECVRAWARACVRKKVIVYIQIVWYDVAINVKHIHAFQH